MAVIRVLIPTIAAVLTLAGCSTWEGLEEREKGALIGGATGAVVGSEVGDGAAGTIIGGAAGTGAGYIIGKQFEDDDDDDYYR